MKKLFCYLLLISSASVYAQHVSGLYAGTLINDSTKRVQHYELALTEYRDKITGYSYTTFVVHDTLYYSIKRVKATKNKTELIVEDDKMLANNFPESPAKRIKQINTIPLTATDSLSDLKGGWKTNATKVYYSIQGSLDMKKDNDSSSLALIVHLRELNIIAPQNIPTAEVKATSKKKDIIKQEPGKEKTTSVKSTVAATIPYLQRQQKARQLLEVQNDSLLLCFYDNGVVDGDVISVYINGQNVISASKLTEAAIKKTVHLNNGNADSMHLTLVAETLGSLPPNTGLLVVQDGAVKYELRFSADLQTNATIVFKKRKL